MNKKMTSNGWYAIKLNDTNRNQTSTQEYPHQKKGCAGYGIKLLLLLNIDSNDI